MNAETNANPFAIPSMRILKISTCSSVTGKANLTYHIGCDEAQSLYFRIFENSGGGYFSHEWVALKSIQKAIDDGPKPTTSFALFALFEGKSVNTPAFLLGAIVNEGLMQRDPENPRCYAQGDAKPFNIEMQKLMASDVRIEVKEKRAPRKKPEPIVIPPKKPSAKKKAPQK